MENTANIIETALQQLPGLRKDLSALGECVVRLEGFMEGIRDAIVGKAA